MAGKKPMLPLVEENVRPPVLCYECDRSAQMRTNRYYLGNVYRPLCFKCDVRLHGEKAEAWCNSHGLFTTQQRMDYCRGMLGTFGVKRLEREPGQDDEERAA